MKNKTFKFKLTTEYEVELPADWTVEQAEFWANDGTWCVQNAFEELAESDDCGCFNTTMKVSN